MFSRTVTSVACVTAILVVCVSAPSLALARQYKVSGSNFTGTESLILKLLSAKLKIESKFPGGETVEIACGAVAASGATILESFRSSAEKINLSSCDVVSPPACELINLKEEPITTITTSAVKGTVEEEAGKLFINFVPTVGSTLATILIANCDGEGTYKLTGDVRCVMETNTEDILKACDFNAGSGSGLEFGAEPADLIATVGFLLGGPKKGLVWSVN
jgi:hypothetical protein